MNTRERVGQDNIWNCACVCVCATAYIAEPRGQAFSPIASHCDCGVGHCFQQSHNVWMWWPVYSCVNSPPWWQPVSSGVPVPFEKECKDSSVSFPTEVRSRSTSKEFTVSPLETFGVLLAFLKLSLSGITNISLLNWHRYALWRTACCSCWNFYDFRTIFHQLAEHRSGLC